MAQQTAIDFLVEQVNKDCHISAYFSKELIEKAKEMEKKQISKAWDDGNYAYFYSKETSLDFYNGKQYYNEIYKNN
jgi:hypothetical protein